MPNSAQLLPFLNKLMARTRLTEREQALVLALPGSIEVIAAGNEFADCSGEQLSSCLIIEGLCARMGQTISGGTQITNFYSDGDMPNLHSVMMPGPTSALCAISTTRVLRVSNDEVREIALSHPGIGEALWRDTVCDAAIAAEWIVNVGCRKAKTRLAHLFCEMATRLGKVSANAFHFGFPVSQEQLGNATGLSTVHTNRSLQALRREGALQMKGGVVTVEDWSALQRSADFDDRYLNRQPPIRFSATC